MDLAPTDPTSRGSAPVSPPPDPVGDAVTDALADLLFGASVDLSYSPVGSVPEPPAPSETMASASGPGPAGWQATIVVRLTERVARLVRSGERGSLVELLEVLPGAAIRVAAQLRVDGATTAPPALRRAVRDALAAEILDGYLAARLGGPVESGLVAETIEYLIELSGTRVEAHDLTHGVLIADALAESPRLQLRYPEGLRSAKRAPLLFDGRRAVLVVDRAGHARTELQRHRFARLSPVVEPRGSAEGWLESGALVAEATRALGGVGFFMRADRSLWTFVDGQPLLVRRGEHWTAFPVELTASIATVIGGRPAAELVARAAFMISSQPHGAILAIVDDPARLDGVVSVKDRFDLRDQIEPTDMRPETWLHHLIDADELDAQTLARLATLDGATILDPDGRLLAYAAIVTTAASQHEGARTAAARTLSETTQVVLKVSVDGDITIFQDGAAVMTLLGNPATTHLSG